MEISEACRTSQSSFKDNVLYRNSSKKSKRCFSRPNDVNK